MPAACGLRLVGSAKLVGVAAPPNTERHVATPPSRLDAGHPTQRKAPRPCTRDPLITGTIRGTPRDGAVVTPHDGPHTPTGGVVERGYVTAEPATLVGASMCRSTSRPAAKSA